jgi:ribose 5-phosphate isomerase A
MSQDNIKKSIAKYAAKYLTENTEKNCIIGMGTGSTVNYLIDELGKIPSASKHFKGMLSTSIATEQKLRDIGINILTPKDIQCIEIYIDGADEINSDGLMIKGGGGALTKEKIIASMAQQFICIADNSKIVDKLGKFPLPIELIPLSEPIIIQNILSIFNNAALSARRRDSITENHGIIVDIHGLNLSSEDAINLEAKLNQIPGVIANGLFTGNVKAKYLVTNNIDGIVIHSYV